MTTPTESVNGSGPDGDSDFDKTQVLEESISQSRDELGATVSALTDRLDVKHRAPGRPKAVVVAAAAGAALAALLLWRRRRNR